MPGRVLSTLCCAALAIGLNALAAESPADTPKKEANRKPAGKKPMKIHEPMQGGMKKDGMMKGDVKEAAAKKEAEMKGMMKQEQKAMSDGDVKK